MDDRKERGMTKSLDELQAEVKAAQARLDEAEAAADEARSIEYRERLRQSVESVESLSKDEYIDPDPRYCGEAPYVLPLGQDYEKFNALDPESWTFGPENLAGGHAVLCYREDKPRNYPTRVIVSSGTTPGDSWRIGNRWTVRHDQTNAKLGEYRVAGIVVYGTEGEVVRIEGEVPNRKLSAAVFK